MATDNFKAVSGNKKEEFQNKMNSPDLDGYCIVNCGYNWDQFGGGFGRRVWWAILAKKD